MSGKKLIGRRRSSISVCYLIDVSPDFYTGGGQVHLANLVRQMQNHKSPACFSYAESIAGREIINHIFGGPGANTFVRLLWCFWVIPQVIFYHLFRQKFSLIHAHSLPAMAAGKILSVILKAPIVVTIHGSTLNISNKDTPSSTGRSILYGFLEKWILTRIKYDAQITVSRDFLEVPNVNKNIVYIPNGVDLRVFKGLALPRQGQALSDKSVLFVGRKNDPVKGFKILEEAFELVKREIPDAKLMVADGSISREKVIKMYLRANLFVLPSLSEGFPLTLLEAWAARLPVVATAVGEVSYIVKDGVNGYLVPPGEVGSLAKAIITALKNPGLAKLGENGYNLAKEYTWERVARETLAVYQKIC